MNVVFIDAYQVVHIHPTKDGAGKEVTHSLTLFSDRGMVQAAAYCRVTNMLFLERRGPQRGTDA